MRFIASASVVVFCSVAAYALPAEPGISLPNVTVGRNLEVSARARVPQPAPDGGFKLTVSSDDPSRLLLSESPETAGSASISIAVLPTFNASGDFWLQGLADSGTVTYTVTAEGLGTAKGTVKLVPAAIVIVGPGRVPKYQNTPGGYQAGITLVSAALDPLPKEENLAGGLKVEVAIANSDPKVGAVKAPKLTLTGGTSTALTSFQPAAEGETTIAPIQPPGFTAPPKYASVVMAVAKPGLAVSTGIFLGKNLQIGAILGLGEPAPPGGLNVTLTSSDSSKLLLSTQPDKLGSSSITVNVPAGKTSAFYYLQGIGDSGDVTYEAMAPGFRSRTGTIGLTPSAVIIRYAPLGPPDEKAVLRDEPDDTYPAYLSLSASKQHQPYIGAYSAYLGRRTGRAADITVQALRPGVSATVKLVSSNPAVATVESSLTIESGRSYNAVEFTPLSTGTTVISDDVPAGFTRPDNCQTVLVIVRP